MSAGCARRGSCCDPVIIEADVFSGCGERARSEEFPHDNDRFITQHWRPLSAWQAEDGTWYLPVRCDAFDPAHRTCTAHDSRPPVCRDFPWYGGEPGPDSAAGLESHCSYLADLRPDQREPDSRPLIPLTVITREAA